MENDYLLSRTLIAANIAETEGFFKTSDALIKIAESLHRVMDDSGQLPSEFHFSIAADDCSAGYVAA